MRALALAAVALVLFPGCQDFERLESDDPAVGEEEVHAAGESGDEQLSPHLYHILENRSRYEDEVVVAALVSVARRGEAAAVERVVALAGDPSEEVRWHVALALEALGGPLAEATLATMAAEDESELVRLEAGGR